MQASQHLEGCLRPRHFLSCICEQFRAENNKAVRCFRNPTSFVNRHSRACAARRWLAEYAQLMRILRADAGRVWSGAAELFELYLLHTYATFADVGLMDVLGRGGATSRALAVVALLFIYHG